MAGQGQRVCRWCEHRWLMAMKHQAGQVGAQLEMLVVQRKHHGRPQWMHLVQNGRDVDAQVEAQDVTMWAARWKCPQWVLLLLGTMPE